MVDVTSQMREAQFFGWDPATLINDMYNVLGDYMADGVDCVCSEILKELKYSTNDITLGKGKGKSVNKEISEKEKNEMVVNVNNGGDEFLKLLRLCFDKNFDKLEVYALRNIFRVDDDLRLENDGSALKPLDQNSRPCRSLKQNSMLLPPGVIEVTEESENKIDQEMLQIRRQIAKATRQNVRLKKRSVEVKSCLEQCKVNQRSIEAAEASWALRGLSLSTDENDEKDASPKGRSLELAFKRIKESVDEIRNVQRRMQRLDMEMNPDHGRAHIHIDMSGNMKPGDTPINRKNEIFSD